MIHLPIKNEYNLNSLGTLLKGKNIRYIFLGNKIDHRLLKPDFPLPNWEYYQGWLRNDKSPYSLEKDLKIIRGYINYKGGTLVNKNPFGEIYCLPGEEVSVEKSSLITNGAFENWRSGSPLGRWKRISGRISRSDNVSEGQYSICFEPNRAADKNKKGTRIVWVFNESPYKKGSTLRVSVDIKAGQSDKFVFFFTAGVNGKRQAIKPDSVGYTGKGGWQTLSQDYSITPGMSKLIFHLWLRSGAREPAFVDNVSIEFLN
jgi:hypothetical protein